jgi:hypothetical protein
MKVRVLVKGGSEAVIRSVSNGFLTVRLTKLYERKKEILETSCFWGYSHGDISGTEHHGHERFGGFLNLSESYLWSNDEVKSSETGRFLPS